MKSKKLLSAVVVGVATPCLFLGFGYSAAYAETSDAVTETIINSALSSLDTEISSPELLDVLQEDIATAVDEGIIDPVIVETVEEILTTPTSSPAPEESVAPVDSELSNLIDENLTQESDIWENEEPAWSAAFETIRSEFESCRTDGQSTSSCARTLGFQLQIAHAQAQLTSLDEAIAAVAQLPEEEQAAALAELEAQRAQLEAKLTRASTKLEAAVSAGTSGASAEVQARLNAVTAEVKSRAQAPSLPEQAQQNGRSSSSNPVSPSQQNGLTSDAPAVEGPSVTVEQAPGKSGSAGRPSNPGSQGQGNANNNGR